MVLLSISLLLTAYLVSLLLPIIRCYHSGKTVMGEVVSGKVERNHQGSQIRHYTISFDGHRSRRRFGRSVPIGEKFPVTYLPGNPETMIKGDRNEPFLEVACQNLNEYVFAAATFVAALLFINGVKCTPASTPLASESLNSPRHG